MSAGTGLEPGVPWLNEKANPVSQALAGSGRVGEVVPEQLAALGY